MWFSEEQAIEKVERELEEYWISDKYASLHGYKLSNKKLEKEIEERIKVYKETEYYKNTGQNTYNEYGTTVEECLEKGKELIEGFYFKRKILVDNRNEFYDGKDTVGEKVCKSWEEYYQTFVNDVMRPEVEKSSMAEFEQIMDEARAFYSENNLDTFQEILNEAKEFTDENKEGDEI